MEVVALGPLLDFAHLLRLVLLDQTVSAHSIWAVSKKMKFFFKTDLQQTQNGFQMWFLCQNMCLVNVEIAGKFQVSICICYKFIAL